MKINKLTKFIAVFTLALFLGVTAFGQITLPATSPYTENFDSIGGVLPTGFTVRTGANSTTLGSVEAFVSAQTSWGNGTGNFRNVASADGLTSVASVSDQNNSTDRAIGLRQIEATDPGAAFVLQLSNTNNKNSLSLTFKFQTLSVQGRDTTFTVDYGIGATPTTFTPITTVSSAGAFGSQNVTANFGSALDNINDTIFIRIVALTASTGSGSRDTVGIDDLSISFVPVLAGEVFVGGRVMSDRGMPIANAVVTLSGGPLTQPRTVRTSGFGYFSFRNVSVGNTYLITVTKDRFVFSQPTQVINLSDEENGLLFTGSRFFDNR